jgi:hypothetical protein
LGKHERPILDKLDKALGGLILLSPSTPLAQVFGWIDQKNEAVTLVRRLLDAATERLIGTAGAERYQLIASAHTVIVITAFFDAVRATIGESLYEAIKISDAEKLRLVKLRDHRPADFTLIDKSRLAKKQSVVDEPAHRLVQQLYETQAPMPSAMLGFEENLGDRLIPYFERVAVSILRFFAGLAEWERIPSSKRPVVAEASLAQHAAKLYRAAFVQLAAEVTEFEIWSSLVEHAATRRQVVSAAGDLAQQIQRQSAALARLESSLAGIGELPSEATLTARLALQRINQARLNDSIVPRGAIGEADNVAFPTVETGYITPRFRCVLSGVDARISDESWWDQTPIRVNLDDFFAAYFVTPASTLFPMILLGHPGAGKSLLTTVLAARLPAGAFTTIRVPLRWVDADAPIHLQIQQALDRETHSRVQWAQLVEESSDTTRVVILDGFDELLQSATHPKTGYIQEVAEFQQREAEMGRPVVAIVTSRTVVADRARTPTGCLVVKLEDFDNQEVGAWLEVWNGTNEAGIHAGQVRPLDAESALRHAHLARQPLLLLMLALYFADPHTAEAERQSLSMASLYRSLIDRFIRREVRKEFVPHGDEDSAVHDRRWHLVVAAFAMFNRGRQYVSEDELNADFAALPDPPTSAGAILPAQQTIGQFLFVHTAELEAHRINEGRRSYEFLHATFGEYLIAAHVLDTLVEMANAPKRRFAQNSSEDSLLFALLSYQPFSTRASVLTFAQQMFSTLTSAEQGAVLHVLRNLLAGATRDHRSDTLMWYRPTETDPIRSLASYIANLVLLRVIMPNDREGVPVDQIFGQQDDGRSRWGSVVHLWQAGLGRKAWESVVQLLDVSYWQDVSVVPRLGTFQSLDLEISRLLTDVELESDICIGLSARGWDVDPGRIPDPGMAFHAALVGGLANSRGATDIEIVARLAERVHGPVPEVTLVLLARYLEYVASPAAPYKPIAKLVNLALGSLGRSRYLPRMALLIAAHPRLLMDFPRLHDPSLYREDPELSVSILAAVERKADSQQRVMIKELRRLLD